jgi:hypothetical protein
MNLQKVLGSFEKLFTSKLSINCLRILAIAIIVLRMGSSLLDNIIIRILLVGLISYIAKVDPSTAILLALAFILVIANNNVNKNTNIGNENFYADATADDLTKGSLNWKYYYDYVKQRFGKNMMKEKNTVWSDWLGVKQNKDNNDEAGQIYDIVNRNIGVFMLRYDSVTSSETPSEILPQKPECPAGTILPQCNESRVLVGMNMSVNADGSDANGDGSDGANGAANKCAGGCSSDADCLDTEVCEGGSCVPKPPAQTFQQCIIDSNNEIQSCQPYDPSAGGNA